MQQIKRFNSYFPNSVSEKEGSGTGHHSGACVSKNNWKKKPLGGSWFLAVWPLKLCQYLVHEFPAFLHHFLIDHRRLVRLRGLLMGLKGVLHQADEPGAPPRISGH